MTKKAIGDNTELLGIQTDADRLDFHLETTLRQVIKIAGFEKVRRAIDRIEREDTARWGPQ